MDFSLTDEQRDFVAAIRDFCRRECGTQEQREKLTEGYTEAHNDGLYRKMAELGWLGVTIPDEYGGSGGGMLEACLFMEESSRGLAPIGGYATTLIVAGATQRFGTDEQKRDLLGGIARGEVEAIAMTEPEAGSDVGSLATSAERVNGGFVIRGQKVFCSNARIARHILVVCRTTKGEDKHQGLSMIWIPTDAPNLRIDPIDTMGGRETAHLYLDEVEAPESAVLGEVDQGWTQLMAGLNVERLILAATMLGIGERAFDDALSYVKERRQFGRPIGSFQALQHRLADLATELEAARLLTYWVATKVDEDPDRMLPARGLDGEAVRHRDGPEGRARGHADDGRLRLLVRVRHGAPGPRHPGLDHLRRHLRDPAQHHRQDARALGGARRRRGAILRPPRVPSPQCEGRGLFSEKGRTA